MVALRGLFEGVFVEARDNNRLLAWLLFLTFRREVFKTVESSRTIGAYTPHGITHILGVEQSIDYVVKHHNLGRFKKSVRPLSELELLLLKFCAWGHDLGMITSIAEDYRVLHSPGDPVSEAAKNEAMRKDHDQVSADYTRKTLPKLLLEVRRDLRGLTCDPAASQAVPAESALERYRAELAQVAPDLAIAKTDHFLELLKTNDSVLSRASAEATTLAYSVNLIARYHRRAEPIEECPEERHLLGEVIRSRLLAAVFRLADAMNVDRTRFEREPFDVFRALRDFTEENRVHWIKSFIVSSIRFDLSQYTVHVQADLPVTVEEDDETRRPGLASVAGNEEMSAQRAEVPSRLREMLTFVVTDLEEDVLSVAKILVKHNFPPLLGVSHEIHEIPAMEYKEDIRAALDNIYSASSPNTSRLITIALDGLSARLVEAERKAGFGRALQAEPASQESMEGYLARAVHEQLKDLREQRERRPCHEGLHKIESLMERVVGLWESQKSDLIHAFNVIEGSGEERRRISRGRLLWTLTEGVLEVFERQRERANEQEGGVAAFRHLFESSRHVVVYGYSEQVIALLSRYLRRRPKRGDDGSGGTPSIHVLECRTKTMYSSSGRLIYLDGQRYAKALRQRFREGVLITLEPDAALGKIIRTFGTETKPVMILLGSNAVYPDGNFVHSMGHLSVAAVAKAPGLSALATVVVVTDSMKIGDSVKQEEERERNPKGWLTHNQEIVAELRRLRIRLHNWREDRVPRSLVDALVILDHGRTLRLASESEADTAAELVAMRFDPIREYRETLERRILASTIAHVQERNEFAEDLRALKPGAADPDLNWLAAELTLGVGAPANDAPPSERLSAWLGVLWGTAQRQAVATIFGALR